MANKLYKPLLIDSVLATEDLPKQRFISFDGKVSKAGEISPAFLKKVGVKGDDSFYSK